MYLAIDIIIAMIEDEEWFKKEVDINKIINPKTSAMTIFEMLRINSEVGVENKNLFNKLDKNDIEVVSFTPEMTKDVQSILNKYSDLFDIGSLDSIHVAHSISLGEPLVSTNQMYEYLDEIEHIDPRKL